MRPRLHRRQRAVCCGGRVLGAGAIPDRTGVLWRVFDTAGVLRRVSDVRGIGPGTRNNGRRHYGDAGANSRAHSRRLHHRPAFMALAVPDQCPSRDHCRRARPVGVSVGRSDRHDDRIDISAAPFLALFLAGLQVVLSEAPKEGWGSPSVLSLVAMGLASGLISLWCCVHHPVPLVDLSSFRQPNFAVACVFSFVLVAGLYGATFLLPLFLGIVRHHDPFEIGLIMIVTGATQLAIAPFATILEQRVDRRFLTACGYALLAIGLLGNGFATPADDFWELFCQQAARGAAFMFCLLPTTALALNDFPQDEVPNASA